MRSVWTTLVFGVIAVSALPTDPVLRKLDEDLRFQYVQGPDGELQLADLWLKASDFAEIARYIPDQDNIYHLFTRSNPSVSQPLLIGNAAILAASNYDAEKRTVVLIHGWRDSAAGSFNRVLVPAFLTAEDLNVIVVDWNAGAGSINYATAVINTVTSGEGVARFVNWLNGASNSRAAQYHITGHSLGGHQSGIVGRHIVGDVAYITALDPALPGWVINSDRFRSTDGIYTEVIHTNAGALGYLTPLGDCDFYPNGGSGMPGCNLPDCDHSRCYFYMAETLTSGGFTGTACTSYLLALSGSCSSSDTLQMGGLEPKTGQTGIYYLETNAAPPFSRG